MKQILDRQRAAFMAELPVPLSVRRDRLRRAIALLSENAEALCTALSDDFGHRSRDQSMITDIAASIAPLRHADRHVGRWMKPERRAVRFPLGILGARAWVEHQPKGVVGIIAPWNFPLQLIFAPLAGVFAAGNRAMVKTSEYTPAVAALLEGLAPRYFQPDELAFVSGGPEQGRAFAALPFDHLLFTGAGSIGRHVMRAAAENLVPVTLELGGKSPTIIGHGADLARAADRIAMGKMLNAGQICLAPDYLLVQEQYEAETIDRLIAAASAMYPTILKNNDYSAIINDRHVERLAGHVKDARAKGAEVIVVNPAQEDFARANSRKMPLHIIRNASNDMTIMREEIFGPVLPIRTYRGIAEAIDYINDRDRPLGLYYFGSDDSELRMVLDRTISGGVTVNDVIFHVSMEDLPFGGVGPSGMGAYHGHDGFRTFSHAKSVYRQSPLDVARIAGLKPPYGKTARALIRRETGG